MDFFRTLSFIRFKDLTTSSSRPRSHPFLLFETSSPKSAAPRTRQSRVVCANHSRAGADRVLSLWAQKTIELEDSASAPRAREIVQSC